MPQKHSTISDIPCHESTVPFFSYISVRENKLDARKQWDSERITTFLTLQMRKASWWCTATNPCIRIMFNYKQLGIIICTTFSRAQQWEWSFTLPVSLYSKSAGVILFGFRQPARDLFYSVLVITLYFGKIRHKRLNLWNRCPSLSLSILPSLPPSLPLSLRLSLSLPSLYLDRSAIT